MLHPGPPSLSASTVALCLCLCLCLCVPLCLICVCVCVSPGYHHLAAPLLPSPLLPSLSLCSLCSLCSLSLSLCSTLLYPSLPPSPLPFSSVNKHPTHQPPATSSPSTPSLLSINHARPTRANTPARLHLHQQHLHSCYLRIYYYPYTTNYPTTQLTPTHLHPPAPTCTTCILPCLRIPSTTTNLGSYQATRLLHEHLATCLCSLASSLQHTNLSTYQPTNPPSGHTMFVLATSNLHP